MRTYEMDPDADEGEDEGGRPPAKNYITPDGHRRLVAELDQLQHRTRPEVVEALANAAAEGDRSENAEYIYRKRQLRQIDSRIRFLARRLEFAFVVDPREQTRRDHVFFGARVTVEDEDGEAHRYHIVGSDEIEAAPEEARGAVTARRISWKSPVAKALTGKTVGDTVTVRFRGNERELTIQEVGYDEAPGSPRPTANPEGRQERRQERGEARRPARTRRANARK